MKSHPYRALLVIGMGIIVILLLCWRSQRNEESQALILNEETVSSSQTNDHDNRLPSKAENKHGELTATNLGSTEDWERRFQLAVQNKNSPMPFFGKVVDQDGNAIPGVRVVLGAREWHFAPGAGATSRHPKHETETDSNGRFEWTEVVGDSISIETLAKEGYRLSPKAVLGYVGASGTADNPVMFKMWRLVSPERLIQFRTLFGFKPDGRAYTLDLTSNKKVEGVATNGDLIVSFERPSPLAPRAKYAWKLELSAIGGGMQETTDEFLYTAPQSGYRPKVTLEMDLASTNWTSSVSRDFYISTRDGKLYGAIKLRIRADYQGESAILVESVLNPNGSRNLQP